MNVVNSFLLSVFLSIAVSNISFATTIIEDTQLDNKNMISLYGQIDDEMAFTVMAGIHFLNHDKDKDKEPIYLLIDSEGGDVFAGGRIIDAMQASKRPIYTVVTGAAMSMASAVHQYGVKRYIVPSGILMFHRAAGQYAGETEYISHRIELTNKKVKYYNSNTAKRSGISLKELELRETGEWWLTSEEAKEKHFVDDIVMSTGFFPKKPHNKKESAVQIPTLPIPQSPPLPSPAGEEEADSSIINKW